MRDRHAVLSSTRQRCTEPAPVGWGHRVGPRVPHIGPVETVHPEPVHLACSRPVMDQSTVRVSTVLVTARFGSGSVAGLRMTAPSVIENALLWQGHSIVPLRTRFTVHPR